MPFMSDLHIRCPECGYEGESIHYFRKHPLRTLVISLATALLYFIIYVASDPRACPRCGNHRGLKPVFARSAV
jgi:DNA-directed RNA polymerase subunit RPC12/RpoP